MSTTFSETVGGKVFTVETSGNRQTYKIDGAKVPASRWAAAMNVAEGTAAWRAEQETA